MKTFPKINPTQTSAWQQLSVHHQVMKTTKMKDLFASNPERFDQFSIRIPNFLFDYSKNIITTKTLDLLFQLAEECTLKAAIEEA